MGVFNVTKLVTTLVSEIRIRVKLGSFKEGQSSKEILKQQKAVRIKHAINPGATRSLQHAI